MYINLMRLNRLPMNHGEHGGDDYRCDKCGDDECGILLSNFANEE